MLQKRIAYHLQKLQEKDSKEESVKKKREATVPESKRQPETGERDRREKIKDIVDEWKLSNNVLTISVHIKPPYAHTVF